MLLIVSSINNFSVKSEQTDCVVARSQYFLRHYYNNNTKKCIYNAPFPKETKRQLFLLQGEWDEDFEIYET